MQQQLQVICFSYWNSNLNFSKKSSANCNMARSMVMIFWIIFLNCSSSTSIKAIYFSYRNSVQNFSNLISTIKSSFLSAIFQQKRGWLEKVDDSKFIPEFQSDKRRYLRLCLLTHSVYIIFLNHYVLTIIKIQ